MIAVATIISGGQTGADRGALDAAIEMGIPHGGTCPKGRPAEDGVIPPKYRLKESNSKDSPERTEANVAHADGTLICTFGRLTGAHKLTAEFVRRHEKAFLHLDLNAEATDYAVKCVREWLTDNDIKVLNVAGGRESESAGLQGAVRDLLTRVFK